MNKKKEALIHKGARVRVADPGGNGSDRWANARTGIVARTPQGKAGIQVLLDGQTHSQFVDWSDVDVEQKPRHTWLELPLSEIRPSRWQYRRNWDPDKLLELAKSIREHGLINRLLVFRVDSPESREGYELIAGERRLRACAALAMVQGRAQGLADAVEVTARADWWDHCFDTSQQAAAGLLEDLDGDTVPCELRAGDATTFREIVILENLQRQDPSPVEEAEAFRILMEEEGYTQAALAGCLGKSQPYVSQRLGLLGLAEEVRDVVQEQAISFSAARAIATLPEAVQPAVSEHVQELAQREGDSQATTRKVQAMTRQIRKFLDPANWEPPESVPLAPATRNRLRMLKHLVANLDPVHAGEAVIELRGLASVRGTNYTGKKPLAIADNPYDAHHVAGILAGVEPGTVARDLWAEGVRSEVRTGILDGRYSTVDF